ncbi:MAG: hypothetical protein M3N97_11840, partial [Pseudomonadota bacterium]|nr:hypothetical protein [Pseudomonadota bacterium]
ALDGQWAALAAALPGYMTAVQSRIDLLGRKPANRTHAPAPVIDLDAARAGVRRAGSLWSKAQAAFAAGNLGEAVATAKTVEAQLRELAGALNVDLSAPRVASATRVSRRF